MDTPELWASFWDHLDDLRQTLLRSLLIIGIGFGVVFCFHEPLIQLFTSSSLLEKSNTGLISYQLQREQVINHSAHNQLFALPAYAKPVLNQTSSFQEKDHTYYSLKPGETFIYEKAIELPLLILSPLEGITLVLKVCFWASLALTAPVWGWVWLQFILPGLKPQEKVIIFPFLIGSIICVALGILIAYYITLPIANQYLKDFNAVIGQNSWTLASYIDYVLLICLGHAIAAELGFLLLVLVHFRLLSPNGLIQKRRYMIVFAFILGALLTPPDIFTQLLLAIPLVCLYELAIGYAKWRQWTQKES